MQPSLEASHMRLCVVEHKRSGPQGLWKIAADEPFNDVSMRREVRPRKQNPLSDTQAELEVS